MPTGIESEILAGIIDTDNTGALKVSTLVVGKRDLDNANILHETDSSYLDYFSRVVKLWNLSITN